MHRPVNTPKENARIEKIKYFSSLAIFFIDDNAEFFKEALFVDVDECSCFVSLLKIGGNVGEVVEAKDFITMCVMKVLSRAMNAGLTDEAR